jgi:DNA-directed RNA polymerase subunit RPC12/RpoP
MFDPSYQREVIMIQRYYVCKFCGSSAVGQTQPNPSGCPESIWHRWDMLGELGTRFLYQCSGCGVEVVMDTRPNTHGCPMSPQHSWRKVSRSNAA